MMVRCCMRNVALMDLIPCILNVRFVNMHKTKICYSMNLFLWLPKA